MLKYVVSRIYSVLMLDKELMNEGTEMIITDKATHRDPNASTN